MLGKVDINVYIYYSREVIWMALVDLKQHWSPYWLLGGAMTSQGVGLLPSGRWKMILISPMSHCYS